MPRPLRLQLRGGLYHLILRGTHRQPLFRNDDDRKYFIEILGRYRSYFGLKVLAFVLMARRVDLLLETPSVNLGKVMQCLGTSYTSYFNRKYRRTGPLFGGRYKSYLIEKEAYLPVVTRYIHRMRLREGLTKEEMRIDPWSSYPVYLRERRSGLVETREALRFFGRGTRERRRRYQEFVEADKIPSSKYPGTVRLQQIVGSPDFARRVLSQRRSQSGGSAILKDVQTIVKEVSHCLGERPQAGRRGSLLRHLAMYLIRRQTSRPLSFIGGLFGVKAPAVAVAVRKVHRLSTRRDFAKKFRAVLKIDCLAHPSGSVHTSRFSR